MASVGIKGFYRQKKKGGVAKPSAAAKKRSGKAFAASAATVDLFAHPSPDLQEEEEVEEEEYGEEKLRQFDLDMRYGPCVGLTRMERWDRACAMGLNPPADVEALLLSSSDGARRLDCLWEGRV